MNIAKLSFEKALLLLENEDIDSETIDQLCGISRRSDQLIATHSKVLPDTLEKLAKSNSKPVLRRIAQNPSAPVDLLLRLAPKFPNEFLSNIALNFLILEDPGFFKKLEPRVLSNFLKQEECPLMLTNWAINSGTRGNKLAILKREKISTDILKAIANSQHPTTAEIAINRLLERGESCQ